MVLPGYLKYCGKGRAALVAAGTWVSVCVCVSPKLACLGGMVVGGLHTYSCP